MKSASEILAMADEIDRKDTATAKRPRKNPTKKYFQLKPLPGDKYQWVDEGGIRPVLREIHTRPKLRVIRGKPALKLVRGGKRNNPGRSSRLTKPRHGLATKVRARKHVASLTGRDSAAQKKIDAMLVRILGERDDKRFVKAVEALYIANFQLVIRSPHWGAVSRRVVAMEPRMRNNPRVAKKARGATKPRYSTTHKGPAAAADMLGDLFLDFAEAGRSAEKKAAPVHQMSTNLAAAGAKGASKTEVAHYKKLALAAFKRVSAVMRPHVIEILRVTGVSLGAAKKAAKKPTKKTKIAKRSAKKSATRARHRARAAKPFQVETSSGSRRFATKAQALTFAKKEHRLGRSSRVAGPSGPLAMFSGKKR